jgi:peptidoglycan/LPS O-acetylase OafA/YrhL
MTATRIRLDGIESLRAYAAVSIIFFHLVGSGGVFLPKSLSIIGTHFAFGVPLFFVVSGFSLAYGYFGRLHGERELSVYFTRRFTRIAPLFYVVLVFQLINVWFEAGVAFTPLDVLLNVVFVFNLVPHLADGIVPASWTIGVEMLFYAIFPLTLILCRNLTISALALLVAIVVGTSTTLDLQPFEAQHAGFVYHNLVSQLPYFMWGILAFHAHRLLAPKLRPQMARRICWALCIAGIAGVVAMMDWTALYMFFWARGLRPGWDALWGIPFGLLCVAMALHPSRLLSNAVTRYLGKISFSIYLVHPTVLYKLGNAGFYQWIYDGTPKHPALAYFVCLGISIGIIVAIASVTFRFIEQPGMNLGKRLTQPTGEPAIA